ncbi:MAG: Maf family protein [Negativicutes bacterium]|nr:Maf family protein [Negativicutes bacterium]
MSIILASASPRRQELLKQLGCEFTVLTSDVVEDNARDCPPAELAVSQARAKALDVAARVGADDIVIGADTIVVLHDRVYGKPVDADDARRMLNDLSGREHHVITGVAVVCGAKVWEDFAVTAVSFAPISADEIERYIASGEPMDKAGAYAIQGLGALLVDSICGCYTNVVGLPLYTLSQLLKKAGVRLL